MYTSTYLDLHGLLVRFIVTCFHLTIINIAAYKKKVSGSMLGRI